MSIHWSHSLLKELLPDDLLDRIREAQVDPTYDISNTKGYAVPFYNGKTGEHIADIPIVNAIRVSRRKMRSLCAESINIQACSSFHICSSSNCIDAVWQEAGFSQLHGFWCHRNI
jgi:hypothetical protein